MISHHDRLSNVFAVVSGWKLVLRNGARKLAKCGGKIKTGDRFSELEMLVKSGFENTSVRHSASIRRFVYLRQLIKEGRASAVQVAEVGLSMLQYAPVTRMVRFAKAVTAVKSMRNLG